MLRFFIPIMVLGFGGALFFGYIQPGQATIKTLQEDIQRADDTIAYQQKDIETKVGELEAAQEKITEDDEKKLKRLIPKRDEFDVPGFVNDINNIALRHGMVIRGATVSGGLTSETPITEGYGKTTMQFTVETTYEGFLEFIKSIEQSEQLVDMTNVTFTAAGSSGLSSVYSVTLVAYWLP